MSLRVKLARARLANIKLRDNEMIKPRKHKLSLIDDLKRRGSSVDASHHHSLFLSPDGQFIGGGNKHTTHKDQLSKHFKFPEYDHSKNYGDNVFDDEVSLFRIMKQTGLVRVQNATFLSTIRGKNDPHKFSLDINTKLTGAQSRAIKDLESFGHEVSGMTERQKRQPNAQEIIKDNNRNFTGPVMAKQRIALQPVNKGIQTFHKVKIDPTQGAEIADAYDAAEHLPPFLPFSMPNNDLFRIVHDVNGHVLGNLSDFSPEGEHQAFLTHRQQYSPEAGKALYTETAGQANWGAFSREHGESNRRKILDGKHDELVFAEQKATILPDHIRNGDHHL
jgi:hypothetical protein